MALSITDDLLRADRNNLTLVRLILASAVIYTHSVESMGFVDEASFVFGRQISWLAVNGFFSLSGFLMYRSLERNPQIGHFALSRFMRIWPGMFAMCLIVAAIYTLFTNVSIGRYLLGHETFSFVFRNQLLIPSYYLTGVNCPSVDGGGLCVINGSLWTIRWEVSCYVAIALVSATGLLVRRRFTLYVLTTLVLFSLFFNYPPVNHWFKVTPAAHFYFPQQIARLWTAFAIGAAAYANRDRIKLSWLGAAIALAIVYVTRNYFFGDLVRAVAVCYWMLCIGFLSTRTLPDAHKLPDYSFGMYIYGMPAMQVYRILVPNIEPHLLALATLVTTVPFAAFSWHIVEKPAQQLRQSFGRRLMPQRRFG